MGLPVEKRRYTVSEYLSFERGAQDRHEYRDGEILAMAGASTNHAVIVANVSREIGVALKGKPCGVYDGDLRIRIPRTPLYLYPDLSVICGEPQYDPNDEGNETVTNPRVLVEVLSPSTEGYDRGEKFNRYRQIETLEEYILVSQETARVETFRRQREGTWLLSVFSGMDATFKLNTLGIEIPMAEIYARVKFKTQSENEA